MPIYRKAAEQGIATFCMKTLKCALWCDSFLYYDIFTVRGFSYIESRSLWCSLEESTFTSLQFLMNFA